MIQTPTELMHEMKIDTPGMETSMKLNLKQLANRLGVKFDEAKDSITLGFKKAGGAAQLYIKTFLITGVIPNVLHAQFSEEKNPTRFTCGG